MDKLTVETSKDAPVSSHAVEIVERKGVGHPDYICDSVMDKISVELSREYIRRFGAVLHHNIDKGLLVAGSAEKRFGGGRMLKPMELIIGDRATFRADGKDIPVDEIARETVKEWFKENLPLVDVERHLKVRVALRPGSSELSGIFTGVRRGKRLPGANDTSAAVGYAPLTPTEKAVFETERLINSPAFKQMFPESGTDVKVMGIRQGDTLDVTVACPLISTHVRNEKDYFRRKGEMRREIRRFLSGFPFKEVSVSCNTLDRPGRGVNGVYLSLLGTSAEDADSGQVGRGNRVNGVISLNRPMGTEAAAGKNPISHVGKIYSVLSHLMAGELYGRIRGVREVTVWLLSRIGTPVDKPRHVYVKLIPKKGADIKALRRNVSSIVDEYLCGIAAFTGELSRGEHRVC